MQLAGLKQADLVKSLDWSKAKANAVWHGDQRLNEDILEELAPFLHAQPYELLIAPEAAMRMRQLEAALRTVPREPEPRPFPAPATVRRKAG